MSAPIWFGVYDGKRLVEVTPGEHHAAVVADDLKKKTKRTHIVLPVMITPVERT